MDATFTTGGTSKNMVLDNYHLMITNIVFCNDTGLKAIIGIHNSVMGPALGN
jgi:hypothetical protein